MPASSECLCLIIAETPLPQLQAVAELIYRTWPKPEKDAGYRLKQLQDLAAEYQGPAAQAPRVYIVQQGQQVIANAVIEARRIGFASPTAEPGEMTIAGLGKVCSDPAHRGEGLGGRVVRAAFADVDRGVYPFSLFQTTHKVRPFYEKIGGCLVENRVINSQHPDRDCHPFQDEVIMRYPAGPGWPTGEIDLRGPGY